MPLLLGWISGRVDVDKKKTEKFRMKRDLLEGNNQLKPKDIPGHRIVEAIIWVEGQSEC